MNSDPSFSDGLVAFKVLVLEVLCGFCSICGQAVSLPDYYRAIENLGAYLCALSARGGADKSKVCDNIIYVLPGL